MSKDNLYQHRHHGDFYRKCKNRAKLHTIHHGKAGNGTSTQGVRNTKFGAILILGGRGKEREERETRGQREARIEGCQ